MLLNQVSSSTESEEDVESCTVCFERGIEPNIEIFEYLPFRNRLANWLRSKESCILLYDGFHEILKSRQTDSIDTNPYFADLVDGTLFKLIANKYGGMSSVRWVIFMDISKDGFDVFHKIDYNCRPIVGMIYNLPMSHRFLMRNAVPFGLIKDPKSPVRLDTYIMPLVEELNEINANGGTRFEFHDGTVRQVQIHLLWVKGDGPASNKVGGFVGGKGKHMCRFCDIEGHNCSHCHNYYFPAKVRIGERTENFERRRVIRKYDPDNLPARDPAYIRRIFQQLVDARTKTSRRKRTTETGISRRTAVYDINSIVPFQSFPLDIMHMGMNLTKSLMELWKREFNGVWGSWSGCQLFEIEETGWEKLIQSSYN